MCEIKTTPNYLLQVLCVVVDGAVKDFQIFEEVTNLHYYVLAWL